jgi:transposase InsO family protein
MCSESVHIKAAFAASHKAYGSRRLRTAMAQRGQPMGRHRVRTLMRLNGLRPVWRRKFVHTTDSKHGMAVSPNVLDRQFEQTLPNQVWVADITYIRTRSGWLYLAAVLDLHSRKIVGWAMANAMPAALVCAALQMAIIQRNPAPGLIVHSDRGTQYASSEHQALLAQHGLVGSMSRKGNCWDNAVMERFFLNLKAERVWHKDYANHAEATNDIADYIVGFYNSIRLHSKLGNMSPNAFERESTSKNLSSCPKLLDHYNSSPYWLFNAPISAKASAVATTRSTISDSLRQNDKTTKRQNDKTGRIAPPRGEPGACSR